MTHQQDILTPHGYHGRYLRIDVGTGRHESVPLPDHVLRSFLGGTGLGVYLMLQEGQAAVDAFDPAAALAFTFSPLVGSPLTTSAKFAVINRSPLTQQYNDVGEQRLCDCRQECGLGRDRLDRTSCITLDRHYR